jgi:hypothetical protein
MAIPAVALLGILIAVAPAPAQSAQPSAALNARIDAAIARAAPGAKLDLEFATPPGQLPSQYRRWRVKDATITMTYVLADSPEAAENLLQVRSDMATTGSRHVEGIGDDAYLMVSQASDANKRMNLRRGKVVVELGVPEKLFDAVVRELLQELGHSADNP